MNDLTNFQEVKMYKCIWCGKIFRSTRHKCMFDPQKRNCFSCKHCTGFAQDDGQYDSYGRCELPPYKTFLCDKEESYVDIDYTDFNRLHDKGFIGDCPYYKPKEGYRGKETYAELF